MNVWVTSFACLRDSSASRKSLDAFLLALSICLVVDSRLFVSCVVGGIDVRVCRQLSSCCGEKAFYLSCHVFRNVDKRWI